MSRSLAALVFALCVVGVFGALPMTPASSEQTTEHIIPEVTPRTVVTQAQAQAQGVGHIVEDTIMDVAAAPPQTGAGSCTWGDYSLSALTKGTGDYKGTDGTYDYKMNVCAVSNSGPGCTDHGYTVCQFSQAGGTFVASLGSFGTSTVWSLITLPAPTPAPEPASAGVMYTMTNGDICWIAGRQQVRTVISVFRCTSSPQPDPDHIDIVEDQTTCTFTITLKSPSACPGAGGGISGGTVFLIILLCAIPIYIGGGCLFNYKKKQTKLGMESFPNREFWLDLPGLVKDGARYAWNMTRSGCKNGKGEAYTQL